MLGEEYEGLRAFWRVSRNGFDPGRPKLKIGNETLVKLVARQPGFGYTKGIYEHKLWRLVLGPKEISADKRDELILILMNRLKLFQLTEIDEFICQVILGNKCSHATTADQYRIRLEGLGRRRSLDGLMLMCLMYRRALSRANLEEAIHLRDEILGALKHYCDRPYFGGRLRLHLLHLVYRRVFCGGRDLTPSKQVVEYGRLTSSIYPMRVSSAGWHDIDDLQYEYGFLDSIHAKQLFALTSIDENVAYYLTKKPELLRVSQARDAELRSLCIENAFAEMDAIAADESND